MLRLGESARDVAAEIDALNSLHMHLPHPLTMARCIDLVISSRFTNRDHLTSDWFILESPGFHSLFGQVTQCTFCK